LPRTNGDKMQFSSELITKIRKLLDGRQSDIPVSSASLEFPDDAGDMFII
jgi:hypothetical protein